MQSGIKASTELHNAFKSLLTDTTQRALLATITTETLQPLLTLPSSSTSFKPDLPTLQPHLKPDSALYILLKLTPTTFAAITYIPNAAPVRQKMLFASTRLTLVRELGIEHFSQTIFATEASELTEEGWERHEAHEKLSAPLTEEEEGLKGAKEAEAAESLGTQGRRGHVGGGGVDVKTSEGVVEAIGLLREEGCKGTLVQLKYQLPEEVLTLEGTRDEVSPREVVGLISGEEPRYSFYSHPGAKEGEVEILFMYTCPSKSKVKERMIYSTGKSWTRVVAERDAGITISRTLEATEPEELASELVSSNGTTTQDSGSAAEKPAANSFARPKRPGRR